MTFDTTTQYCLQSSALFNFPMSYSLYYTCLCKERNDENVKKKYNTEM